jgi:hypothetical protein
LARIWIPKEDSQVQRLLATREDIFFEYTKEHFEKYFTQQFDIIDNVLIKGEIRKGLELLINILR